MKDLSISGDTRFDVRLVRIGTSALSGVVTELTTAGLVPVEDARVEELSAACEKGPCAPSVVQAVSTDRNGRYAFSGLYDGPYNFVWVTKPGYELYEGMPGVGNCEGGRCLTVTITADTEARDSAGATMIASERDGTPT